MKWFGWIIANILTVHLIRYSVFANQCSGIYKCTIDLFLFKCECTFFGINKYRLAFVNILVIMNIPYVMVYGKPRGAVYNNIASISSL